MEVVGLLTTVYSGFQRASMHAVREVLLDRQADAVGMPCHKVHIPWPRSNERYESEMSRALAEARGRG